MSNQNGVGSVNQGLARGELVAAALAAVLAGCGVQPGTSSEDTQAPVAPPLAVAAQALTTPVQGMYVASAQGSDGYCDAVLFAGNHGAAIQSCIDRANADGGGVVLLRAGTYSSGTWPLTLKSNVTLLGAGNFGARLAPSAAQAIGTVQDNAKVQGVYFVQDNLTEGAIRLGPAGGAHSNLVFEGNQFQVTTTATTGTFYSIYAPDGANSFSGIAIRNNSFVANLSAAANIVNLKVTSGQGTLNNIRVENNDFLKVGGGGLNAVVLSNSTATAPSLQIVANGNTFRTANGVVSWVYGIFVRGALDVQATGNTGQTSSAPITIAQGAATSCGGMIVGNSFRGGSVPAVEPACVPNSTVVANTQNVGTVGTGKTGVLVHAHKTGGSQDFTAGTQPTLTFDTADINYGLSFVPSTGIFTAPVAGVYRMHACARFSSSNFTSADSSRVILNYAGAAIALSQRPVLGASTVNCVDDITTLPTGGQINCLVDGTGTANTRTVLGTGIYSTYIKIERLSD